MTTIPLTGPVDDAGRLLHEDDLAAQLALSLVRLEAALDEQGRRPADLAALRVLAADPAGATGVLDVLDERLRTTGADPAITVVARDLPLPGMQVALEAVLRETCGPDHASSRPPRAYLSRLSRLLGRKSNEGNLMTITTPSSSAATLRGACEVHLPGDPGYDVARQAWNLAADQRPAAVAIPTSVAEVASVVRAAAAAGLRVAPQSTGHGASALAEQDLSEVVVVRLSSLTGVSIDAAARTASVVGGTLWQDVVAAAAPYGLTALHGSAPDVAVAGYALSGGLSFYGRTHGVAANSVRAVDVVTADGALVHADATEHADLYWAVRGGGGNLGVVVGLELDLLPYADVYAGMLLWDRERAPEVVRAWAAWSREAPESATTSLRVMSFPPLPELPPFLSGRDLVIVDGAVLEDDDRAAEVLAPLRALAPEMDTFGRIPSSALLQVHLDPPAPTPAVSDHRVLGELTDAAVDAFLGQVGPGTASGLMFAELRHLGGAFARPVAGGGAVSHVPGEYALFCVAVAPFPEAAVAGRAAARGVVAAMAPWSTASLVPTFAESRVDTSAFYDGEDWVRLAQLREQLDPTGVMVANHPV
ncbi:FAD-binding protein [Nocardioides lianchengensis]|uniref:FAD/FMN-containing dehydrogenase n=1 Tax=Nocardioides lianchengensis TaxID=1045774 RepID=A0A1G6VXI6_9ACTN|nr:FAD-binding protein [Nocardioides lianchengensis]NYG11330.1 FAD/FMN-containing dehydrogenase/enamine deaminase RidA (YjgF/YER057c/UK114 family) [Nocardioides lianchengensis]SDD58254.1 FAD/FMN-containing dehydrogenase [Nocardioides lianchengensis]